MEPAPRAQGAISTASAVPMQAAVFGSFFSDEPDGAESDNVARLVEWFHGLLLERPPWREWTFDIYSAMRAIDFMPIPQ